MDKEDLFKLAQCTSDDDTQAPEDVVKALLGVAAKGKPAAVKEMSEWLINRLGESESARVKLKVLRLMMQIMSSKKGAKFKAQLRQDGEAILRATTAFETQIDPEHGEKPMLFVRKSAVKCLALLELPTEPAAAPAPTSTSATSSAAADLAERKKALEQRKAALAQEQAAAAKAAAAATPNAAPAAAKAPSVAAGERPVVAPAAAPAPALSSTSVVAPAGADIDALVRAQIDAVIAPKIAAAEQVTARMDKLERIVEEKIAEARRESLQTQERLAVVEHEFTERMEQLQASAVGSDRLSELESRLRKTMDEAAKAMTEGGEAGLTALHAVKLDEMAARLTAAESASFAAATESRTKSETLGGLLLQLRNRANATEEDGMRLAHALQQLEERLESAKESLSAEIATVSTSTASASADSAGQAALREQLAALDQKFSDANKAQAAWLEQQLAQSNQDASAQISAVELNIQTALLEGESKTMDAVVQAERKLASTTAGIEQTVGGMDEKIATLEEGMEAGIGDRCDELQGELDQFSAIVLAMKGGQDATRDKLATHEAQLEEFEATRQIVEESVAASSGDIELLKQEFTTFTQTVEGTTESMSSLVARMLATEEENYDTVLAEANLSSVIEYNRAASRRLIKLTKSVERLGDKVETCQKGQQKSWQAINEMQGRMQTIRDTVVRMTR